MIFLSLIDFFTMYTSTIPYIVYFHLVYDAQDSMKKSLLWMIPFCVLFYITVNLSYLIPDELLGMSFKTVVNSLLYIIFFMVRFRKPFLHVFSHICMKIRCSVLTSSPSMRQCMSRHEPTCFVPLM